MFFLNIAVTLFLCLVFLSSGLRCLRLLRVPVEEGLEEALLAIGLGIALISFLLFFLGIFGLLYKPVVLGMLVLLLCVSLKDAKRIMGYPEKLRPLFNSCKGADIMTLFMIVFTGGVFFYFLLISRYPLCSREFDRDCLVYLLNVPKLYIQNHKIIDLPCHNANLPLGLNMIWMVGLMGANAEITRMLSLLVSLITFLTLYLFGSRFFTKETGLFAGTIFLAMPICFFSLNVPKVDIGFSLYSLYSVYCFFCWNTTRDIKWALLCGVFTGFACSIKTFGPAVFLVLLLWYVCCSVAKIKQKKNEFKRCVVACLAFIFPAIALGSPWYVKSYLYTGDPLSFSTHILNFKDTKLRPKETSSDERSIAENFQSVFTNIMKRTLSMPAIYGMGGSFKAFIKLPWNITFHPRAWNDIGIGGILLSFIPLLVFFPLFRKVDTIIVLLLVFAGIYAVFWFYVIKQVHIRYLFPTFPLLTIVAGYSMENLGRFLPFLKKTGQSIILFTLLVLTMLKMVYTVQTMPFFFGLQSREEFLAQYYPPRGSYDVIDYINKNLSSKDCIFTNNSMTFYINRRCITKKDDRQNVLMQQYTNVEEILKTLKARGCTHVLFDGPRFFLNIRGFTLSNGNYVSMMDDILKHYGKLVYKTESSSLYQLRYPPLLSKKEML